MRRIVVVAQPLQRLEELAEGEVDRLRLAGVEAPDVPDLVRRLAQSAARPPMGMIRRRPG